MRYLIGWQSQNSNATDRKGMIMRENATVSSDISTRFLTIRTAIAEMQGEATYIQGKLFHFDEAPSVRELLGVLVEKMNGALWDARSEYQVACEKLAAAPDDEELPNLDPTISLNLLIAALHDLMGDLTHAVEQLIAKGSEPLAALGLALVVSCGENLVKSFNSTKLAAQELEELLTETKQR